MTVVIRQTNRMFDPCIPFIIMKYTYHHLNKILPPNKQLTNNRLSVHTLASSFNTISHHICHIFSVSPKNGCEDTAVSFFLNLRSKSDRERERVEDFEDFRYIEKEIVGKCV